MASAVRQVVRQHKRLIKFPNRIQIHKNPIPNQAPEFSSNLTATSHRIPSLQPLNVSSSIGTVNNSSTSTDVPIIPNLPFRYRRRLITQDEMEYIERGGPE